MTNQFRNKILTSFRTLSSTRSEPDASIMLAEGNCCLCQAIDVPCLVTEWLNNDLGYAGQSAVCPECIAKLLPELNPSASCNPPGYNEELEKEKELQARLSEMKSLIQDARILAAEVQDGFITYSLTTSHRLLPHLEDHFIERICSQPWYTYDSGVIWLDNQTKLELTSDFHGRDLVWRTINLTIPTHLQRLC